MMMYQQATCVYPRENPRLATSGAVVVVAPSDASVTTYSTNGFAPAVNKDRTLVIICLPLSHLVILSRVGMILGSN